MISAVSAQPIVYKPQVAAPQFGYAHTRHSAYAPQQPEEPKMGLLKKIGLLLLGVYTAKKILGKLNFSELPVTSLLGLIRNLGAKA